MRPVPFSISDRRQKATINHTIEKSEKSADSKWYEQY